MLKLSKMSGFGIKYWDYLLNFPCNKLLLGCYWAFCSFFHFMSLKRDKDISLRKIHTYSDNKHRRAFVWKFCFVEKENVGKLVGCIFHQTLINTASCSFFKCIEYVDCIKVLVNLTVVVLVWKENSFPFRCMGAYYCCPHLFIVVFSSISSCFFLILLHETTTPPSQKWN